MEFIYALCVCGTIVGALFKLMQGALWLFDVMVETEPKVTHVQPQYVAPVWTKESYLEWLFDGCENDMELRMAQKSHPEEYAKWASMRHRTG